MLLIVVLVMENMVIDANDEITYGCITQVRSCLELYVSC